MKAMRRFRVVSCVLLFAGLLGPAMAGDSTVGRFYQGLAEARGLDGRNPEVAVTALTAAGIGLPEDLPLDAALTERDLVRLSSLFALRVSTSTPDARVGESMLRRYFEVFGPELDSGNSTRSDDSHTHGNGNGNGWGHYGSKGKGHGYGHGDSKGKGKGKRPHTPSDPN